MQKRHQELRLHYVSSKALGFEDLTQSYNKSPTPTKNPKCCVTTQKSHKNFDYTTIADQLKRVGQSNDSYLTGVIKPV